MKGMLLISSGIDSPVAGKLMSDKGVELIGVHLCLNDWEGKSGKKEKEKLIKLAKKAALKSIFFADLRPAHHTYSTSNNPRCNPRLTCVFCKRTMLRIAEKIAENQGCDFLVTGENLGQVASQTFDNMTVTDKAVKMKILRPLLGFDKSEIVALARKYRTYELSIQEAPSCPFLHNHPVTTSKPEMLKREEEKIKIEKLVAEAARNATQKSLA